MNTKNVVRNVRLDDGLDEKIRAIAAADDRSISNVIQRLLRDAVSRYVEIHPELAL